MRNIVATAVLAFGLAACADNPAPNAPSSSLSPTAVRLSRGNSSAPIPGQYIVRFRDDVADVDGMARSLAIRHHGTVKYTYKSALKGMTLKLPDAAVEQLRSNPNVLSIEQDQSVSLATTQTGATWGIDRVDQQTRPLSGSYTYNATGSGVTVYILDTGINFTHNEFGGRAVTGIDEITSGGTAADCNGHGTHVSGTVGGTTYGIAKNVQLVSVRVLDCTGHGAWSGIIAGIDWVTANKHLPAVVNMSIGGPYSASVNQAVENSIAAGVVYAIAAGNDAVDACTQSPSSAPSALVVGATDINDGFASFSNWGSCVKLNAPGVSITSAWIGSNTATNTIPGTSMASPHVAGAAALLLQSLPTASPAVIRSALTGNATSGVISGVPSGTPNLLLYTGFITSGGGGGGCGEASCVPVTAAYISHYTGAGCTGTESYYTQYFGNDGVRRSWDGRGMAGTTLRTVTNRSWKDSAGQCHDDWPSGNTLSGFVTIYRDACGEAQCVALAGAYISHFTNGDCTGTESYYTPYFNNDGQRRSWDGKGVAGTVLRTVTNRSWKTNDGGGDGTGCRRDAWPSGNTLSNFVTIYR